MRQPLGIGAEDEGVLRMATEVPRGEFFEQAGFPMPARDDDDGTQKLAPFERLEDGGNLFEVPGAVGVNADAALVFAIRVWIDKAREVDQGVACFGAVIG